MVDPSKDYQKLLDSRVYAKELENLNKSDIIKADNDKLGLETSRSTRKANPNNVKINVGQQDKHIQGTNNYKQSIANGQNRSILKENPQQLIDNFAQTGQKIPGTNKERIDFGMNIGQYYDQLTGEYVDTTKGIIHYDSKGRAHIVPAKP